MTSNERDLLLWGFCPFCFADLRGFFPPRPLSSGEIYRHNQYGYDAFTGHKIVCTYKDDVEALIKLVRKASLPKP